MKSDRRRRIEVMCAALAAVFMLTCGGCDTLTSLCNKGPGTAILTLCGTGIVIQKKYRGNETDNEDNDTYQMIIAAPDSYIRWRSTENQIGAMSLLCLNLVWPSLYGSQDVRSFIYTGGSESGSEGGSAPLCIYISNLVATQEIVIADVEFVHSADKGEQAFSSAVIYMNKAYCPLSGCIGSTYNTKCIAPYAGLDNATLSHGPLEGAELQFASLTYANLRYANLSYAALNHATLSSAHLNGANLSHAVLYYADLTDADLTDAEFDTANVFQTTAPDGTVVDTVATLKDHLLDD